MALLSVLLRPSSHLPTTALSKISRASSDVLSVRSPQLLHNARTGRIDRARSNSSRLLSIRNQEAIWEAATGRNYTPVNQLLDPDQSLPEFITPSSLPVGDIYPAASCPPTLPPLDSLPGLEEESDLAEPSRTGSEAEVNTEGLRSMEFMMPSNYSHFGSHPSSYQSNYLDQYSGADQDRVLAYSSPQPSSYAPSYTTSPAIVGSSPALSPRAGSVEGESSRHYTTAARSPYATATTSAQTSYTGYATASHAASYGSPSYSSNDPYASNAYAVGYGHGHAGYTLQSQPTSYAPSPYTGGSYDHGMGSGTEDPAGVRVVNSRPKPQCWDHGCNGRQFSTFSNLLRHQREKSGAAQKSTCPRCGAVFTRTTARNGHMAHDKCKRKSLTGTSDAE